MFKSEFTGKKPVSDRGFNGKDLDIDLLPAATGMLTRDGLPEQLQLQEAD